MMRIFLGEADKLDGEPLYEAIVKRLRMMDIAGATVYKGVLGYGAKGHTHKAGMLHFSRDLPIMISVVDSEEKIKEASDAVEAMLGDGLLVLSNVDRVRLIHEPEWEASTNADHSAQLDCSKSTSPKVISKAECPCTRFSLQSAGTWVSRGHSF